MLMPSLQPRLLNSSELNPDLEARIRGLLDTAFNGKLDDDNWINAVGGTHALLHRGEVVLAHASAVNRKLCSDGSVYACRYIEAVAVHPDWQRRGLGMQMMALLQPVLSAADFSALCTGSQGFYRRLGWQPFRGRTWVHAAGRKRRTADEDASVMLYPGRLSPPLNGDLVCEARAGDDW